MKQKKTRSKPKPELGIVIVSIVSGLRHDEVLSILLKKYDVTQDEAEELIKQAREKITLASNTSAREELSLALRQLEDLYKRSIDKNDLKLGLDARKERNRLLNLYDNSDLTIVTEALVTKTEEMVRSYLEPLAVGLGYAESNLPLEELARLTSAYITEKWIKNK